jgi:hypothetical protein
MANRVRRQLIDVMLRSAGLGAPSPHTEALIVKRRDRLTLLVLLLAMPAWFGCAHHGASARRVAGAKGGTSDPCAQKKPGQICVPELPSVAPVVAGEGRLWGLFARSSNFEIREYSTKSDGVLAKGACPSETVPAVLGAIDQQPALLCANFGRSTVVFGRKLPNSQNFVWQEPEALAHDPDESVKSISHFALLERRLGVVFRTESRSGSSGLPTIQWRLQIAGAPSQLARQMQPSKPPPPPQTEVLCPRPGVTRCDQPPVTAYVADGQMHVVLASGMSADKYLHLAQAPGKPSTTVPVEDVAMAGKSLKGPCVSKTTNGNLKVFVPSRSLVSALMSESGERVGVIQHGTATIAQGPDVLAGEEDRCPPEVSALAAFPMSASGAQDAHPQWLRATQSNDIWIIGYGVPSFATKQNGVTTSYSESFWVVRR